MNAFKTAMLAYAKAVLEVEADDVLVTYNEGYSYSEYTQADARFDLTFMFEGQYVKTFDGEDAAELFRNLLYWEDGT